MKCYKCGNDIEDNLECPFCGYINKEGTRKILELMIIKLIILIMKKRMKDMKMIKLAIK